MEYNNKISNPCLTENAQNLRKNMTKEERHLWYDFLKTLPFTFNRQKVIGKYIVDFYCAAAKLVIELDGGQHCTPKQQHYDEERSDYLRNLGITVLRYSNLDVNRKFSSVCADILLHLTELTEQKPSP